MRLPNVISGITFICISSFQFIISLRLFSTTGIYFQWYFGSKVVYSYL
nr:MAG TPA: hypothetical protein [Caudoviricetes sp.]